MKRKSKKGFAILYAVVLVVLIGMISVSMLSNINTTSNTTTEEHIRTQMDLYTSSTIEYALLWMSQNKNFSSGAMKTLNITYPGGNYQYTVLVRPLNIPANIPESAGTVMLDVIGTYIDGTKTLRTEKRTIQKP